MKFLFPASTFIVLVSAIVLPQNPTLDEIEAADVNAFKFIRQIRTAEAQSETNNPSLAEIEASNKNAFKFFEVVDTAAETETQAENPTLAKIEESNENAFKFFQIADTTTETNTDDEVLEAEELDSPGLEARLEKEREKRQ